MLALRISDNLRAFSCRCLNCSKTFCDPKSTDIPWDLLRESSDLELVESTSKLTSSETKHAS